MAGLGQLWEALAELWEALGELWAKMCTLCTFWLVGFYYVLEIWDGAFVGTGLQESFLCLLDQIDSTLITS